MASNNGFRMEKKPFGSLDGKSVELFVISDGRGASASIASYGGTLVSMVVPDRKGRSGDVTLGHPGLEGYLKKNNPYFGCLIGRYGNRIGGAAFTLDGKHHTITANDGANCLHGGARGFDKVIWKCREVSKSGAAGVELEYSSRDSEEGFPGNLDVTVVYWLTSSRELTIEYTATTDAPTIVNLTNHAYWNLAGEGNGTISGHMLTLHADRYTPVGQGLITTGEIAPVRGTPLDFTGPVAIGERIDSDFPQLSLAGGYDHNFVVNGSAPGKLSPAAMVYEPESGRTMEVLTTEPGVQLYCGNLLDGSIVGKSGKPYSKRGGFCLETQHYPDSPNKPGFPSVVLRPGQEYRTVTVHRFSAR